MIKIECKDNVNISFVDGSLVLTIEDNKNSEIESIPDDPASDDHNLIELNRARNSTRAPATPRQKHEIKELKKQGYSRKEVAHALSLSYHQVARYWHK